MFFDFTLHDTSKAKRVSLSGGLYNFGSGSYNNANANHHFSTNEFQSLETIANKISTSSPESFLLMPISDESTFQPSLQGLCDGAVCVYETHNGYFMFGNSYSEVAHDLLGLSPFTFHGSRVGGNLFGSFDITNEPKMPSCKYTLKPESPFYQNFYNEALPFIEHIHLQNFIKTASEIENVFRFMENNNISTLYDLTMFDARGITSGNGHIIGLCTDYTRFTTCVKRYITEDTYMQKYWKTHRVQHESFRKFWEGISVLEQNRIGDSFSNK